ncbi:unnamed protein product [Cuscuta campestris]|uniref:Uncharacterized protein n=1 Tax=Cuscuta campestris TaxID=132261 RepID=A0A484KF34_9ASTE|nr:unnamed protein product [Cuscuta campestris]
MAKHTDPLDALPTGLKLFIKNLHSLTPEKLDDTNFPSWIATTSANLSAHRLMGYVDGSIPAPPTTITVPADKDTAAAVIPNPEFEVWSVINAQLCACLLAIVTPSVQHNLHGLDTAAGDDSMQKYLDSVVKIVAALDRSKAGVLEQDVVLAVLRGLPSDYASIKQNIRTNIATVTFAQVSSRLLAEELNLQMEHKLQVHDSSSSVEPHAALYAQSGYGGRGRGRNLQRGRGLEKLKLLLSREKRVSFQQKQPLLEGDMTHVEDTPEAMAHAISDSSPTNRAIELYGEIHFYPVDEQGFIIPVTKNDEDYHPMKVLKKRALDLVCKDRNADFKKVDYARYPALKEAMRWAYLKTSMDHLR